MPAVLTPPSAAALRVLGGAEVYERVMDSLRASEVSEADLDRYVQVLEAQGAGDMDEARRIAATISQPTLMKAVLAPLVVGR